MNDVPDSRRNLLPEFMNNSGCANGDVPVDDEQLYLPDLDRFARVWVDPTKSGADLKVVSPLPPADVQPVQHPLKIEITVSPNSSASVFVRCPVDAPEFVIECLYHFLVFDLGVKRVSLYKVIE